MWVKLILLLLFCLMILSAVHFAQPRESEQRGSSAKVVRSFRLLTWNIGYAELEDDTRAHDKDLPAVAEVIMRQDPDAVALQEVTGNAQLKVLLGLLHGKYRGSVAQQGNTDRFEAVLVKDPGARFIPVPVGDRYALGLTVSRNGTSFLRIDSDAEHIAVVNNLLVGKGIKVYELSPAQESLEEAFLRLTESVAATKSTKSS
jgi:hypothetical protein